MRRIARDVGPDIPPDDPLSLEGLLIVELAAAVLPAADRGRPVESALLRVGPVDAPLTRLRVVQADRQTVDVGVRPRAVDVELVHGRAPAQDASGDLGSLELHPFVRAGQ